MPPPAVMDLIDPATAEALLSGGTRRRYARGSWLFHENDPAEKVLAITSGIVKVQKVSDSGRVTVLGFREAGCLLGEQSALDGEPMLAGALALVETDAVVISSQQFLDTITSCPDLALALLQQMNWRLRQSARLMHDIATADAVTRVANRLMDLTSAGAGRPEAPAEIQLPVSQQDLAEWAGLSREAVVRALRILRDDSIIETGRLSVTVLDRQALADRAHVDLGPV